MTISADNFWIELDRLLGAPTTAAQMEALMESYGPVWLDIHDKAINSPDHFSRLLKKGRLPLTLNCESDSYANKGMAGGIDARFGCADG